MTVNKENPLFTKIKKALGTTVYKKSKDEYVQVGYIDNQGRIIIHTQTDDYSVELYIKIDGNYQQYSK